MQSLQNWFCGERIPWPSATFAGREVCVLTCSATPRARAVGRWGLQSGTRSRRLSVAEGGGMQLVTDVQKAGGPLSPARYCEEEASEELANLVRKMEQDRMVCSFMPIVGKNSGYGGDCPGEHPNHSGRTQSRTQPSKPRHCRTGETCGRQSKGKEIPPRVCATPEGCALVCTRRETRSIVDVSKDKKERAREAVEGRRGLSAHKGTLVPALGGHLSRAVLMVCHVTSCPAEKGPKCGRQ